MWVILDDEQDGVALLDVVAIVLDTLFAHDWQGCHPLVPLDHWGDAPHDFGDFRA